jgi:hypothetical protein
MNHSFLYHKGFLLLLCKFTVSVVTEETVCKFQNAILQGFELSKKNNTKLKLLLEGSLVERCPLSILRSQGEFMRKNHRDAQLCIHDTLIACGFVGKMFLSTIFAICKPANPVSYCSSLEMRDIFEKINVNL